MLVSGATPSRSIGLRGYSALSMSMSSMPPGGTWKGRAPATLGESINAYMVKVPESFGGRSNQKELKRGNSSGRGNAVSTAIARNDNQSIHVISLTELQKLM